MSKVDWITWKTDVTDIINPEKVIDSVTDLYNEFNSYMNPVIYENLKYEVINGGLDKSSINILGHSPANEIALNILNNIDEIKSIIENLKLQLENATEEQKKIEKNQLVNALDTKIEEEKQISKEQTNRIIRRLEERKEIVKAI